MGDQDHFGDAYYAALDDAYDHPDEDHRKYCAGFARVGCSSLPRVVTCEKCGEYLTEKNECPRCG